MHIIQRVDSPELQIQFALSRRMKVKRPRHLALETGYSVSEPGVASLLVAPATRREEESSFHVEKPIAEAR